MMRRYVAMTTPVAGVQVYDGDENRFALFPDLGLADAAARLLNHREIPDTAYVWHDA